jgi:hypothetical protein
MRVHDVTHALEKSEIIGWEDDDMQRWNLRQSAEITSHCKLLEATCKLAEMKTQFLINKYML